MNNTVNESEKLQLFKSFFTEVMDETPKMVAEPDRNADNTDGTDNHRYKSCKSV